MTGSNGFSGKKRPLRVLQVIDKLGFRGRLHGAGKVWLNTLKHFHPDRCEVIPCVLRLDPAIRDQFFLSGIKLRDLKKGKYDPTAIFAVKRIIEREKIDLLHLHNYGAGAIGRIAGFLAKTPTVIHQHDTNRDQPEFVAWIDKFLSPITWRAIAVSDPVADLCVERRHVPRERVCVLENALEPDWAASVTEHQVAEERRRLGIPDSAKVIGTVTRLYPVKNTPAFVRAARRIMSKHDCHFVVVGEGPERAAIEREIRQLGLESRMHLTGYREDVRPCLGLMDIVVFSSEREGFSIAVLEAMALSKPIVATDVPGMREILRNGENALLAPANDDDSIAAAVGRLLDDTVFARRLGGQGKRDSSQYEMPRYIERLEDCYESIYEEWNSRPEGLKKRIAAPMEFATKGLVGIKIAQLFEEYL